MSSDVLIPGSVPAALVSLACLVGGAAWFADALRALRFRRAWRSLAERPLAATGEGPARVRGRVALAGPLFSPLGRRPCAGFVLEVHGADGRSCGSVRELRAFDLQDGDGLARVTPEHADWTLPVSHERSFAPGESPGAALEALLDRHPELAWLRRRGGVRVVERALHHGDRVTVIGEAACDERRVASHASDVEWLATGTDGGALALPASVPAAAAPALVLGAPEGFPLQVLADGADAARVRVPSIVRTWGAALGPALALAGLLALARLAGAVWGAH